MIKDPPKDEGCLRCGHPSTFINPITSLCHGCEARQEWEENFACRRCLINERDPRSLDRLCTVCMQAQQLG